jgi:hypothetical protein
VAGGTGTSHLQKQTFIRSFLYHDQSNCNISKTNIDVLWLYNLLSTASVLFRSVPSCPALVICLLSSFCFYVEISLILFPTHYMAFLPAGLPCNCGGERKLELECFPGFLPPLLLPTREGSRWPMYDVAHSATCVHVDVRLFKIRGPGLAAS